MKRSLLALFCIPFLTQAAFVDAEYGDGGQMRLPKAYIAAVAGNCKQLEKELNRGFNPNTPICLPNGTYITLIESIRAVPHSQTNRKLEACRQLLLRHGVIDKSDTKDLAEELSVIYACPRMIPVVCPRAEALIAQLSKKDIRCALDQLQEEDPGRAHWYKKIRLALLQHKNTLEAAKSAAAPPAAEQRSTSKGFGNGRGRSRGRGVSGLHK